MRLITLGVGAALGYFLGSREGRKNLEKMSQNAQKYWNDPKTQERVHAATDKVNATVKDKAPGVAAAAEKATHAVQDAAGKVGVGGKHAAPAADEDTVSDPLTRMEDEGPATTPQA